MGDAGAASDPRIDVAPPWWRRDRTRTAVGLLLVAGTLLICVPGLMRYQGAPMEEGFMLAFPEQLLNGRLPHRDFLHLYGPGSLWVLAAVFKVFGATLEAERTVGLLQHAGVAFGLFFLLKPFGRWIATSAAVTSILVLIGPGGLTAMAWNGGLALGIVALAVGSAAVRRPDGTATRWMLALSGVLGGAALLYRPDLILAVALGLGALMFALPRSRRLPLVIGWAVTMALYVPHLLLSGVGDSFRGMFLEPVFELRPGRALPVPPSWGEIDGFLQRAGALRTEGWPFPMPAISNQIFLWFFLVPLSIVVVVVAAWRLRRREPGAPRAVAFWAGALFAAALAPQAMQRPDTTHLAWVTGITFPLLIPAVASLLEEVRPRWSTPVRAGVGIGVLAVVFVAVIPFFPARTYVDLVGQTVGRDRFGAPITNGDRTFYFGSAEAAASAQEVVDTLARESRPGERLIVGPTDLSRTNYNDSFVYWLFPDLVPGTRYIEMDPGIANSATSGLAEELRDTDWLVLSDSSAAWREPNTSEDAGDEEPNRIVRDEFCMVTDAGNFQLLRRCA